MRFTAARERSATPLDGRRPHVGDEHLPLEGVDRQVDAELLREHVAESATGDHDGVRSDVAAGGADAGQLPALGEKPTDPCGFHDLRAAKRRSDGERLNQLRRVRLTIAGEVQAGYDLRRQCRLELASFIAREPLDREAGVLVHGMLFDEPVMRAVIGRRAQRAVPHVSGVE